MHGIGAVQKLVEVKETLLILHFASDRKQVCVAPNKLWGWDSVVGIATRLRAARTGVRIPAGGKRSMSSPNLLGAHPASVGKVHPRTGHEGPDGV
jgi:hypothetical protein